MNKRDTASEDAEWLDDDAAFRELGLLYNYADNDSRQFTRWQMIVAMRHGIRLRAEGEMS